MNKPTLETKISLDFHNVKNFMIKNKLMTEEEHDLIWDKLCDWGIHNGSYENMAWIDEDADPEDLDLTEQSKAIIKFNNLIEELYPENPTPSFWISW